MKPAFLFTLSVALALVRAQTPAATNPSAAFEVVSVKPNKSGTTQSNIGMPPNGLNIVNLPLRPIIQLAYGINQPSKLVGIPDWTNTERFDVSARAAGPVTTEEHRVMMQALLADRFKLVARREKREISVFALVLDRKDGKLGPHLVESKGCTAPAAAAAAAPATNSQGEAAPLCGARPGGPGKINLVGMPMQTFASVLSLLVGRTVADKTGLTGRYDIELSYTPDQPAPAGLAAIPADPNGPSIFTAVREQLGLKFDSQRELEDVLVIEHVERPSEN